MLDDDLRDELDQYHNFTASLEVAFEPLRGLATNDALKALDGNQRDLTMRYMALNEHLGALLRAELGRTPSTPAG